MKMQVHNILEAKILIKEAYKDGNEERLHHVEWRKHSGEFLFVSLIRPTCWFMASLDGEILEKCGY